MATPKADTLSLRDGLRTGGALQPGHCSESQGAAHHATGRGTSVLALARYEGRAIAWSLLRLALGPRTWMRNPSVLFAKVLGSGFEGGFGVRPSWDRQGLFLVFDGRDAAQRCLQDHPLFSRMRERASELLVAQLEPIAMRGQWAGHTLPYFAQPPSTVQPIVAITRASIRARGAARFWSRAPQAQASLEAADGCWLAAGLGEAPLLRQMTFSIWDSEAHMRTFARQGAHQQAIQAAATEGHFSESMFARYRLISLEGQWNGKHWSYSGGAAQPLHSAHAI